MTVASFAMIPTVVKTLRNRGVSLGMWLDVVGMSIMAASGSLSMALSSALLIQTFQNMSSSLPLEQTVSVKSTSILVQHPSDINFFPFKNGLEHIHAQHNKMIDLILTLDPGYSTCGFLE